MKKSNLRKIIRESIKQLMTEQTVTNVGTNVNLRTCGGGMTIGSLCVPNSAYPSGIQIGDHFRVTQHPHQPYVGRHLFVRVIMGSCTAEYNGTAIQVQPETSCCTNCSASYGWQQYQQNFGGACTNSCNPTTSGCPGWSNYSNWESTFTSLPNFTSSNPNQPCQFLCQRNTQWSAQISTVGPQWATQLQCKIDKVQDLMQQNNCASSNAPAC
tara:strand:- start:363 stop:998 length:636 start_codon:yes stop_codon:yes gene_type:complete